MVIGGFYYRDKKTKTASSGEPDRKLVTKMGFGIGITAVSRVGGLNNLYGEPPVISGIALHSPTSGSLEGLQIALDAHNRNGFDHRLSHAPNAKLPNLAVDMGYSVKKGFTSMVLKRGSSNSLFLHGWRAGNFFRFPGLNRDLGLLTWP